MGEAKRRKKLDSSYGKVPLLKTIGQQQKHVERFVDDLYSQCEPEIKTLIKAEKIPDNYQQIRAQLAGWLENRLSKYRESDRQTMAVSLFVFCSEMFDNGGVSPMIIICFLEILKPYLSSEVYKAITERMKNIVASFKSELEMKSIP